jgi:tetratricopeptide (TPR) repeat protein
MRSIILVLSGLVVASPLASQVHDHTGAPPERLGSVDFPITCAAAVQAGFARGVALVHSFWWEAARQAFAEVAAADPRCAMAHWGAAMTARGNPFAGPPSAAGLEAGLGAIERALAIGSGDARERAFIEALAVFFRDHASRPHAERARAYEDAMRGIVERFPGDREAAAFYAREIAANTPPTDKTFERQRLAASILMPHFEAAPDHPGLAHYLIHTFDAPPIAGEGVLAASEYTRIAPSVPHALHMPSHIFTRLGMWRESIEANTASAEAARRFEVEQRAASVSMDRAHAWDYLVYAHLQMGEDRAALELIREASGEAMAGVLAAEYAASAMPARYALERGAWDEAASLEPGASNLPAAAGVRRFARGIGAARLGRLDAAVAEMAALEQLRDELRRRNDNEWAERLEAQRLAIGAWVASARGNTDEALTLARHAADLEEFVDKHPVTPGPILPARELQGDLLMALGRPVDALQAYEAALAHEPNRSRTLFGAAQAAEAAGEPGRARELYAAYLRLMWGATGDRPQIQTARDAMDRLR